MWRMQQQANRVPLSSWRLSISRTLQKSALIAGNDLLVLGLRPTTAAASESNKDHHWFSTSSTGHLDHIDEKKTKVDSQHYHKIDSSNKWLRPSEVVRELDKHIVGQQDAKRTIANACRMRWRRRQLPADLKKEVKPRNVLLIGPTGCGKTEIARKMADLSNAPFIKVEATKYTEVGYHGRDVDQIIRDLLENAIQLVKKERTEEFREQAKEQVEEMILDALFGQQHPLSRRGASANLGGDDSGEDDDDDDGDGVDHDEKPKMKPKSENSTTTTTTVTADGTTTTTTTGGPDTVLRNRDTFRGMLQRRELENNPVEITVPRPEPGRSQDRSLALSKDNFVEEIFKELLSAREGRDGGRSGKSSSSSFQRKRNVTVAEAREILTQHEVDKLLASVDLKKEAIDAVEERGIVFIDEIDKIVMSREANRNTDASAEGVQRDLLPVVEGTTIDTKHGNINTDHILFIASGAFHSVKPSDMLPELQGRFPIRVELKGLGEHDLYRILTEPVANLVLQQVELMKTEGVDLVFTDDGIREISRLAALANKEMENIGARRLHTVMERIVDQVSYDAPDMDHGTQVTIDKKFVAGRLQDMVVKSDQSKYIL